MSHDPVSAQLELVCDLLRRCAEALRRDCPTIYQELCLRWQQMELRFLLFPAEHVGSRSDRGALVRLRLNQFCVFPLVVVDELPRIETSLATVVSLVEGDDSVHEALMSDRLQLFATPEQLSLLVELGRLFVAGALRSEPFADFLSELRDLREAERDASSAVPANGQRGTLRYC